MKLSEKLKQDHDCGDFGKALVGYSDRAAALELDAERYRWLRAHAGEHQGPEVFINGKYELGSDMDKAIDAAMLKTPNAGG